MNQHQRFLRDLGSWRCRGSQHETVSEVSSHEWTPLGPDFSEELYETNTLKDMSDSGAACLSSKPSQAEGKELIAPATQTTLQIAVMQALHHEQGCRHQPAGCRRRSVLQRHPTKNLKTLDPKHGAHAAAGGAHRAPCGSRLLSQEAPEAPGDQAFDFGLTEKSSAAPHLDSGAAVPLSQLCCSRPCSCPWPLLAAAPLLAGACARLPDPRLAEPLRRRCIMVRPHAALLLLGISHAAASIKALPILCSMPLTMGDFCLPASVVTAALLLLCSMPLLLSGSYPAASMVTAALLLPGCRLSAVPVLSVGSEVAPLLLLLLPPAQRCGPACLCRAHRT